MYDSLTVGLIMTLLASVVNTELYHSFSLIQSVLIGYQFRKLIKFCIVACMGNILSAPLKAAYTQHQLL